MKNKTGFCGGLLAGSALMFSAFATSVDPVAEQTLWVSGVNGYDTYRIPAIVTTKDGSLLAFCEGGKHQRASCKQPSAETCLTFHFFLLPQPRLSACRCPPGISLIISQLTDALLFQVSANYHTCEKHAFKIPQL